MINRFSGPGIAIATGNGNTITGNYIGTDVGGIARPNTGFGVFISSGGNRVGGITVAARNVISSNGGGIALIWPAARTTPSRAITSA